MTAYTHVLAGSARDNVIDIFNVVFGDLQRAATHRGQKRRAGELRDYDQAVAAVHTRMRLLLDALDDQAALAEGCSRASAPTRAGIEASLPGLPRSHDRRRRELTEGQDQLRGEISAVELGIGQFVRAKPPPPPTRRPCELADLSPAVRARPTPGSSRSATIGSSLTTA